MNGVIRLLKSHRSIRKFTDEPLEEGMLQNIIEAGHAAATSSNLQARSVVRVTDEGLRRRLSKVAGNQQYITSAAEFLVFCADLTRARTCCDMQGKVMAEGMTEQFIIATTDVALMAQNCVVAAEALGLGICYIGALRNDPQAVCELLQLPDQVYPVFGLCLGYPAQDPEIKPRLPFSAIVKTNVWRNTDKGEISRYDDQLRAYYRTRTGGTKDSAWTQEISALISKESRPHMRAFLKGQGFVMK